MKKYALILAGGAGLRAGGEVPKQFRLLKGIPVLWWSVRAFHKVDPETLIRIVMHPGFFDLWDILFDELPEEDRNIPVELVCGGRSRIESVANGLTEIPEDEYALVAVHDAARPMVSVEIIENGWATASAKKAAIPVVPMIDSIRELLPEDDSHAVDRSRYVRVQTPQVFEASILKKAYSEIQSDSLTDDASVVEASGMQVALYPGEETNMKITNPLDFKIAEVLIADKR